MPVPPIWIRIRHTLGRALRETGQALDRVGIRGHQHAITTREFGDDPYIFENILSRHRNIMPLLNRGMPKIDHNVEFIAPCSSLIGNIEIGSGSSVWYGAVLRADRCNSGMGASEAKMEIWRNMTKEEREEQGEQMNDCSGGGAIIIGKNTNVQDGVIITSTRDHTIIGDGVTIGHSAQIHSSRIESNCLIGMGAVLNPGVVVESFSFIAAGAVIPSDVTVKEGELWVGNPGRKLRDLSQKEKDNLIHQADEYVSVANDHRQVMQLGGNVSDNIMKHFLIEASTPRQQNEEKSSQRAQLSEEKKEEVEEEEQENEHEAESLERKAM